MISDENRKEKLPEIYNKIKTITKIDMNKALKMMVDIYPEVADSYYHDIADSINIWILTKGNKETGDYILSKLPDITDDSIKNILKDWVDELGSNGGNVSVPMFEIGKGGS